MGRLESLTAWALGRGPYEPDIIEGTGVPGPGGQQYNDHGRPINPETKRRERETVRAANEVMLVTGVVEDSNAAKAKAKAHKQRKNEETFTGLRLMEIGRASLVGGVWGVLGLRRRILLYKPYSELSLLSILRQESAARSFPTLLYTGLPAVVAYHVSDWTGFIIDALIDDFIDEEDDKHSRAEAFLKHSTQTILDASFFYITLHFRMFAILQQLHLMPSSRLLPSLRSFIPFTEASPFQLPPTPCLNATSLMAWGSSLFLAAAPIVIIFVHGKVKYIISRLLYRPIYKCLPRPTGDSMFSGIPEAAPALEYDAPDRNNDTPNIEASPNVNVRVEDPPTLRALEGHPTTELQAEPQRTRREPLFEMDPETSDEEDGEMAHATLISFDVEATESMDHSLGGWSAELRSAHEPKQTKEVKYRVTGLTLLPTILATEGLREVVAGILVMPLEAAMVRIIARTYRQSAGLSVSDLFRPRDVVPAFENLFSAFALQLAVTGVVWAGFTYGSQWWGARKHAKVEDEKKTNLNGG